MVGVESDVGRMTRRSAQGVVIRGWRGRKEEEEGNEARGPWLFATRLLQVGSVGDKGRTAEDGILWRG